MTAPVEPADPLIAPHGINDKAARRTVMTLIVAQCFCGAMASLNIAISTLAGAALLENDALATLPATTFLFGTMCSTVPASYLGHHLGRRPAFVIGALIGAAGGLIATFAVIQGLFAGLLVATFVTGASNAFVQQYRFAAADQASPAFRPKAISWVMLGGIMAGIVGAQSAIYTTHLIPNALYAGCFVAQTVLCLLGIPILATLSIPTGKRQAKGARGGRSLAQALKSFPLVVTIVCGACAYAVMSLVMTAAPLAMKSYQHTDAQSTLGIQWHVIAMFLPSVITGSLIVRFGAQLVMTAGFLLLGLAAFVGYLDTRVFDFWLALIFLGVGWNFGFVGATTKLADIVTQDDKGRIQALNELVVFTGVAIASLSSGLLLELIGWHALLLVSVLPILLSLFLLALLQIRSMPG